MKPEALSIESKIFDSLRQQTDMALNQCIAKMRETGMDEGSVSVKVGLMFIDSERDPGNGARVDTLKIDGKVGMTVPMRYESKIGSQIGIKCAKGTGTYMIADGQISMDEVLEGYEDDEL